VASLAETALRGIQHGSDKRLFEMRIEPLDEWEDGNRPEYFKFGIVRLQLTRMIWTFQRFSTLCNHMATGILFLLQWSGVKLSIRK